MKQPQLGKTISDLRKQKGLTQEELVNLCNISVRTIQRIEAGEVTPRLYTIKTILSALDYDLERLNPEEKSVPESLKDTLSAIHFRKVLNISVIFGIVYFLLGFVEFIADWSRWFDNEMYFSTTMYIAVKVSVLISYVFFIRAFVEAGRHFKNELLKLSGISMIIVASLFYVYELSSLYNEFIPMEIFLPIISVVFGAVGVFFGIGLLKLQKQFRNLALATGGLEILVSLLFLTVILGWLGYIFLTPVILLEVVLLYRIAGVVKSM